MLKKRCCTVCIIRSLCKSILGLGSILPESKVFLNVNIGVAKILTEQSPFSLAAKLAYIVSMHDWLQYLFCYPVPVISNLSIFAQFWFIDISSVGQMMLNVLLYSNTYSIFRRRAFNTSWPFLAIGSTTPEMHLKGDHVINFMNCMLLYLKQNRPSTHMLNLSQVKLKYNRHMT